MEYNLQGVIIVDIHSLTKDDSFKLMSNPVLIQRQITKSLWDLQETYNDQLMVNEGAMNDKQIHDEMEKNLEKSKINQQNIENYDYYDIEIPTEIDNQNPFIITFSLKIKWIQEIQDNIFFVNSSRAQDRTYVQDIMPQYGELTMTINFWKFNLQREQAFLKFQNDYFKKKGMVQENEYDIQINSDYFNVCYQEIMYIGGGSFGKVDLYYDRNQRKLFAVKQLLDIFKDPIDIKENEIEYKRIIQAVKESPKKLNDSQIEYLNRNVVREIKVLKTLNLEQDERSIYINRLEGVVLPFITQSGKKQYQTIKLVFEHFGGCETNNNTLTCDIYRYFSNQNNWKRFTKIYPTNQEKVKFIKMIFYNILVAVGYLHEKGVMIRDLKDDNILIRRIFDPNNTGESTYQIQLIDFGLSKKHKVISDQTSSSEKSLPSIHLEKGTSIVYQADSVPSRHPIYRYTKPFSLEYDYKDDVYALGVLLFRLHNYFQLLNHIDIDTQKLIEMLTGLSYDQARDYVIDMMAKRVDDASECLKEELQFDEKDLTNLQNSRNQIYLIKDIPFDFLESWIYGKQDKKQALMKNSSKHIRNNRSLSKVIFRNSIVFVGILSGIALVYRFLHKRKTNIGSI